MELPISIPIKRFSHCYNLPKYATSGSAGLDLYAAIYDLVLLQPNEKQCISTGIAIKLPEGYEGQIRPCYSYSGLHGSREDQNVEIINAQSTIDSDYIDEIKVFMINRGKTTYEILPGAIIAKIVIAKYTKITWETIDAKLHNPYVEFANKVFIMPKQKQKVPVKNLDGNCCTTIASKRSNDIRSPLTKELRLTVETVSDDSDVSDEEPLHRLRISLASLNTSEYAEISEAKNILQELLVENNLPLPKYTTDFKGPTNNRTFMGTATVQYSYAGHTIVQTGEPELTKKDAEKSAAFSVLKKLKL